MNHAQKQNLRFAAVLAGYALFAFILLWALWQTRRIWPPFFVSFIIALALTPVVDRLETRGWPRWLATAGVYLFLFAALGALLFVLVPMVGGQVAQIAADMRAKYHLDEAGDISRTMQHQIRVFGREHSIPAFVLAPALEQAKNSANLLTAGLETFGMFLAGMVPNLIWVVLVPIVAFYALIDYHRIFAKILLLVPRSSRDEVRNVATEVSSVFSNYLRGLGFICLLDTIATIGVLLLFAPTRPYAAALGLIAGIFYAVPYLGAFLSTALISLVALTADGGSLGMMLGVTASMLALHQLFFDQVLAPRILGGHVGLHPILSIIALMAGDALFGIGGMLLAVPVAASIQIVILHLIPRLRKRIEVKMQPEAPEIPDTLDARDTGKVTVIAGEGVVTTPGTRSSGATSGAAAKEPGESVPASSSS